MQKITDNPEILLNKLSAQASHFSLNDIAIALNTQLEPANQEMGDPLPPSPKNGKKGVAPTISRIMGSVIPKFLQNNPQIVDELTPNFVLQEVETPKFDFDQNKSPQEIVAEVLEEISKKESVFTEKHLTKVLSEFVAHPSQVAQVLMEIKQSSELLAIGPGEDGRERYTTRTLFELESNLQDLALEIQKNDTHQVSGKVINQCIKEFNLKDDQAKAIRHILKSGDIACIVGRAGTGKSYSLKAARAAWEKSGFNVYGVALAGIAADNLEIDSGIKSRTIESFSYALKEGTLKLGSKDIVVMDEAGMTDSISMSKVVTAVHRNGAKLVLVGDPDQLQPVGPGALFRALLEQLGFAELTTIRRQEEVWQREATLHFAVGNTKKALEYYEQHGHIHLAQSSDLAMDNLINDWQKAIAGSTLQENLIVAYKNQDVDLLNMLARRRVIKQDGSAKVYTVTTHKGKLDICHDERILFLENNWRYGVKNGQRGTVIHIDSNQQRQVQQIHVQLDGKNASIVINPEQYQHFTYGYACTVHRAQGVTVKNNFVYVSGFWNRFLTYVAMTRHKENVNVYASENFYKTTNELKKALARSGLKDSVLDYPLAFAARRGIDTEDLDNVTRLQKHIKDKFNWILGSIKDNFEQTFSPKQYWEKKAKLSEKEQTIQETLQRRVDAKKVAAYIDANREVAIAFEALKARKEALGIQDEVDAKKIAACLSNHRTLINLRKAMNVRNELAYQIYSEHGKYTQVLAIYDIHLDKLAKESEVHQRYLNIVQYQQEMNQERTVHRDKIAAVIQDNIKSYYPILIDKSINTSLMKTHAFSHQKRNLLRGLSVTERQVFRQVEDYMKLSSESAKHWKKIIEHEKGLKNYLIAAESLTPHQLMRLQTLAKTGKPLLRETLMKAKAIDKARDSAAAIIASDIERYKVGLNFYQVGETREQGSKAINWAKERLERLLVQAERHHQKQQSRELIQEYLITQEQIRRYEIANQIISHKESYYTTIFEICPDPKSILRVLYQDARAHLRLELIKGFNDEEHRTFLQVERYVKAKKAIGQIHSETQDFNPEHPAIKNVVLPHLKLRDELAFEILKDPKRYQKSLEFFNIKIEHLSKNAFYHQVRNYCSEFKKQAGNLTARMALARQIVANNSAYVVVKNDNGINWQQLQNYADYAIKQERLAALTPEERQNYQTALKYKRLRREAGKLWHEIYKQKNAGLDVAEGLFDKAIALNAKRNELAFVIKTNRIEFDELLFSGRVQAKDINKHAIAYEKQLANQQQYQAFINSAQKTSLESLGIDQKTIPKSNNKQEKGSNPYWDLNAVNEALIARASLLVESLLGPPNRKLSNSTTYRYNNKGSLSVTINGPKAGLWYNFQTQEKGNLIKLIQNHLKSDFKEAIKYAASWTGIAPESDSLYKKPKNERQLLLKSKEFTADQLEKITYAKEIATNSIPIAGTLAERYLKEHRGIDIATVNDSFRFNASVKEPETQKYWPALVAIAKNSEGNVQSVQCIYLDPKTANKLKVKVPKRTYGPQEGASVLVQEPKITNNGYQYALAEGPETALSVAQSNKSLGVIVTLGVSNFAKTPLPSEVKNILICADNDGINADSEKSLNKAVQSLAERGLNVYVAKPVDCEDFNDVLLKHGESEVNKIIDNKALAKKAFTLEQLMNDKETLTSDHAKIIAEFSAWHRSYNKVVEPDTIKEIKAKGHALEYSGKIASFIKKDPLLMEIADRFEIKNDIIETHKKYKKQTKIIIEVAKINSENLSKDFIKDYMELNEELTKLIPPWISKDKTEIDHWHSLNAKAKKLAFVIEYTPELKDRAKSLPNYRAISVDADSYRKSMDKSLKRDIDIGMGY